MSIQVRCAACGKRLAAPDSSVGRKARCPACGQIITVPPAAQGAESASRPPGMDSTSAAAKPADGRWKSPHLASRGGGVREAKGAELLPHDVLVDVAVDDAAERQQPPGTGPAAANHAEPGNPFATTPDSLPSYDPLARGQKATRRRPFVQPLGQRGLAHFLLGHKMALLVASCTALLAVLQIYWLVTRGFSLFMAGATIAVVLGVLLSVIGFLPQPHRPHKRSVNTNRARRVGSWFIAGVIGIIVTSLGIQIGAFNGLSVPLLAALASPLLFVFSSTVLISAIILLFYLLITLFPRITGFEIAAGIYLALTIGLPLLIWQGVAWFAPDQLTAGDENSGPASTVGELEPGADQPARSPATPPAPSPADQTQETPHLFRDRSLPTPGFPRRDEARTLVSGVDVVDVLLDVSDDQPGHNNRLRVYTPSGSHAAHSLPCVLVASGGTNMLSGSRLADDLRHPAKVPYVLAGYVVVAYELDGEYRTEAPSAAEVVRAYREFAAADAGVVNGRNALEYVLARIPEVDPARIYAVGHGPAATVALLLAAQEPRISGCVSFAGIADLQRHVAANTERLDTTLPGVNQFVREASPITHADQLACPVMLFHAEDDSVIPLSDTVQLAETLRNRDQNVEVQVEIVSSGGHDDAMLEQGIPRAIQWLDQLDASN